MKEIGSLFLKRRMMREYHVRCCESLGVKSPWLLDHARRYFFDALANDAARAEYALSAIKKLYDIEAYCKEHHLSIDQTREKRQTEAVPVLSELGKWMQEQYIQITPKSAIGVALAYSIKRWEKLSLYTGDGKLQLDNYLNILIMRSNRESFTVNQAFV